MIITTKVISGHGESEETNFETQDKLYLLSGEEIYSGFSSRIDTSVGTSKQLDYYKNQGVTTSSYAGAIKEYNGINSKWWLRSAYSFDNDGFLYVYYSGYWYGDTTYKDSYGVSPAFRIA